MHGAHPQLPSVRPIGGAGARAVGTSRSDRARGSPPDVSHSTTSAEAIGCCSAQDKREASSHKMIIGGLMTKPAFVHSTKKPFCCTARIRDAAETPGVTAPARW